MSKGKVWNRGKHNGKGLPERKEKVEQKLTEKTNGIEGTISPVNVVPTRVNTVQRMSRENWVQRATPIKREDKKDT
jgi:hypothetical protein